MPAAPTNPVQDRITMQAALRREAQRAEQKEEAQRKAMRQKYDQASQGALESLGLLNESQAERFPSVAQSLETAAATLRAGIGKLAPIFDSPMLTEGQRILTLADKSKATEKAALAQLQGCASHLAEVAKDVERRKKDVLTPPQPIAAQVAEVRAVLRTMPADERAKLLHEARSEGRGDDVVLLTYAIASAPAFMSGANVGEYRSAVRMVYGLRDPALLHLVDELPAMQEHVQKAIAAVPQVFAGIVDYAAADALRGG